LLVDRSSRIGSGVGALVCSVGSALQSDRAEVRVEMECYLMKRSHIEHRQYVDRQVLAGGVDEFMVAGRSGS
jgi:hypothetical protein